MANFATLGQSCAQPRRNFRACIDNYRFCVSGSQGGAACRSELEIVRLARISSMTLNAHRFLRPCTRTYPFRAPCSCVELTGYTTQGIIVWSTFWVVLDEAFLSPQVWKGGRCWQWMLNKQIFDNPPTVFLLVMWKFLLLFGYCLICQLLRSMCVLVM